MTQVPTTDQIRNAIDSGVTGEKVGFPDSAAAPLSTNAEAGGNTPTRTERAMESEAQIEQLQQRQVTNQAQRWLSSRWLTSTEPGHDA